MTTPDPDLTALAPLVRVITAAMLETPITLGSPQGSADLPAVIAVRVAAYVGREVLPPPDEETKTLRLRTKIAEAELRTLRSGIRALGGDPTQVQNLWAQLHLRNKQWAEAKRERDRHAATIEQLRQAAEPVGVQPPVGRAAVLREAADAVFALDYDVMVGEEGDENLGSMREAWDVGTIHATQLLRRMADEEQPATEATVQLPYIHTDDDGDQLVIAAVMASTYDDNGAPVVSVCALEHGGDDQATVYVRPEAVERAVSALRAARVAAEEMANEAQQAEEPRS